MLPTHQISSKSRGSSIFCVDLTWNKNNFSGKPSYSVTKTMKFITNFDKKSSYSYYTCIQGTIKKIEY